MLSNRRLFLSGVLGAAAVGAVGGRVWPGAPVWGLDGLDEIVGLAETGGERAFRASLLQFELIPTDDPVESIASDGSSLWFTVKRSDRSDGLNTHHRFGRIDLATRQMEWTDVTLTTNHSAVELFSGDGVVWSENRTVAGLPSIQEFTVGATGNVFVAGDRAIRPVDQPRQFELLYLIDGEFQVKHTTPVVAEAAYAEAIGIDIEFAYVKYYEEYGVPGASSASKLVKWSLETGHEVARLESPGIGEEFASRGSDAVFATTWTDDVGSVATGLQIVDQDLSLGDRIALPNNESPWSMVASPDGAIWMTLFPTFNQSRLQVLRMTTSGTAMRAELPIDDVGGPPPLAFAGGSVWVGGDAGIAAIDVNEPNGLAVSS